MLKGLCDRVDEDVISCDRVDEDVISCNRVDEDVISCVCLHVAATAIIKFHHGLEGLLLSCRQHKLFLLNAHLKSGTSESFQLDFRHRIYDLGDVGFLRIPTAGFISSRLLG